MTHVWYRILLLHNTNYKNISNFFRCVHDGRQPQINNLEERQVLCNLTVIVRFYERLCINTLWIHYIKQTTQLLSNSTCVTYSKDQSRLDRFNSGNISYFSIIKPSKYTTKFCWKIFIQDLLLRDRCRTRRLNFIIFLGKNVNNAFIPGLNCYGERRKWINVVEISFCKLLKLLSNLENWIVELGTRLHFAEQKILRFKISTQGPPAQKQNCVSGPWTTERYTRKDVNTL
jgi:hypothetical protein